MPEQKTTIQTLYQEMVLGVLLYVLVLGLFNDYTDVLFIDSFTTLVAAAFVMQLLITMTFGVKSSIASRFKGKIGKRYKALFLLSIWFVLFVSKFVFLIVIDWVFGNNVNISGFFGLTAIIICATTLYHLLIFVDKRLGD
jgi:uncharacterized membrane protein